MSLIALSSASGRFGRLVLEQLLSRLPASRLVAVTDRPEKLADLARQGVELRAASYEDPAALQQALRGVRTLLLVSSRDFGSCVRLHGNLLAAASGAGVGLVVYTSILHADTTALPMGPQHLWTEGALRASGLPHVILRNGWFFENYLAAIKPALAHGGLVGSAGAGRISAAARSDFAEAAVAALTGAAETGRTYELAGDHSFTLPEFAAEVAWQLGRSFPYVNLPEADYAALLMEACMRPQLARDIASWDTAASKGALFDESRELSRLIGHPTRTLTEAVRLALNALKLNQGGFSRAPFDSGPSTLFP